MRARSRRVLTPASPLKRRLLRLYDALARRYGAQDGWRTRSRFDVLIGAILTQGTAGVNVARALVRLRAHRAPSLAALRALSPRRLASVLRPAGVHHVRAARLAALVRHVTSHHGGSVRRFLRQPVPILRRELRRVPGFGPRTADAVLLYAAGRPVFVVDDYVRRVLARHRVAPTGAGDDALQAVFMDTLPRDPGLYSEFHALLVRVGKEHCRAVPHCEGCPLRFDLRGRRPRARPLRTARA